MVNKANAKTAIKGLIILTIALSACTGNVSCTTDVPGACGKLDGEYQSFNNACEADKAGAKERVEQIFFVLSYILLSYLIAIAYFYS